MVFTLQLALSVQGRGDTLCNQDEAGLGGACVEAAANVAVRCNGFWGVGACCLLLCQRATVADVQFASAARYMVSLPLVCCELAFLRHCSSSMSPLYIPQVNVGRTYVAPSYHTAIDLLARLFHGLANSTAWECANTSARRPVYRYANASWGSPEKEQFAGPSHGDAFGDL
eukprot:scaffold85971_cov43-Tisochrysis_lutea.AAC.3